MGVNFPGDGVNFLRNGLNSEKRSCHSTAQPITAGSEKKRVRIWLASGNKPRKYPYPEYPGIQQATGKWGKSDKWGEMGKHGGKWGEMGGNGGKGGEMGGHGGKWGNMGGNGGGMGGNGGTWGKMGANKGKGGEWEIVTSTSWKMYEIVPTRKNKEGNGVDMGGGGGWMKNGTRSGNFCTFPGPIFPIFPKGHQFPYRVVNEKRWCPSIWWKNGKILRYPQVSRKLDTF